MRHLEKFHLPKFHVLVSAPRGCQKEPRGTRRKREAARRNREAQEGTERHQKEPRGTRRNREAPEGTERHQKEPRGYQMEPRGFLKLIDGSMKCVIIYISTKIYVPIKGQYCRGCVHLGYPHQSRVHTSYKRKLFIVTHLTRY